MHAKIKADISNNAVLRYLRGIIYGAFGKTTYCYFEDVNRPGYIEDPDKLTTDPVMLYCTASQQQRHFAQLAVMKQQMGEALPKCLMPDYEHGLEILNKTSLTVATQMTSPDMIAAFKDGYVSKETKENVERSSAAKKSSSGSQRPAAPERSSTGWKRETSTAASSSSATYNPQMTHQVKKVPKKKESDASRGQPGTKCHRRRDEAS